MFWAYFTAIVSVLLGVLLGVARRNDQGFRSLRTFAFVAALVVVLTHLLPEALAEAGLWTLLPFFAGVFLPHTLSRWVRRARHKLTTQKAPSDSHPDNTNTNTHSHTHTHTDPDWVLELGFVGLLVHKLGDGAVLGSLVDGGHADVLIAIAVHTVPVTALIVLTYRETRGLRSALIRGALLAVVSAVGVALTTSINHESFAESGPWITALVAGLLMHIVLHDWHAAPVTTPTERALDLLAVVGGVALILLGGGHPNEAAQQAHTAHGETALNQLRHALGEAFVDLSLETAPSLLLGLLIAAVIQAFGSRISVSWLSRGGSFSQALRGAVTGAPLPVCACGVLPVAHSLQKRGAGAALVVAFLLATPEIGVESFALTVRFLGWRFAVLRMGVALLVAIVAGVIVARMVRKLSPTQEAPAQEAPAQWQKSSSWFKRALTQFDELVYHTVPWALFGLIIAAYAQATLGDHAFARSQGMGTSFDILVMSLLAVPTYVCAASATPLAAVLMQKGLSPGAALTGLLLGPATNLATLGWMRATFGKRASLAALLGILAVVWGAAFALNASGMLSTAATSATSNASTASNTLSGHEHGIFTWLATGALAALVLRGIAARGIHTWLGALRTGLGDMHHDHDHNHDHHHHHDHNHNHHHHGHTHER